MKIRIEKLEIEVPRELVSTIQDGLLSLKQLEADRSARAKGQRESLLFSLITAAINMMQVTMRSASTQQPSTKPADSAPQAAEPPATQGDDTESHA